MVQIQTEIKGLRELVKDVNVLKQGFAKSTLRTALRGAARPVLKLAKEKVPVRTGNLRRSLGTKVSVKRSGFGTAAIAARRGGRYRGGYYGGLVELGTSRTPARPYLRPAIDEAERSGDVQNAFIEAINKTIQKRLAKNRAEGIR